MVLKSARRRNAPAIAGGRLTLVTGGIEKTVGYMPADLVLACHVLYFWADPVRGLRRINEIMAPAGHARARPPVRCERSAHRRYTAL